VRAITNGVHSLAWTSPGFVRLYDAHLPGWCHEPEILARADSLPDEAVWAAHQEAKGALLALVKERAGVALSADLPILGFARRMTGYKRPDLLFTDLQRLKAIASRLPFQVVLAGKAHPRDAGGKALVEALHRHARELERSITVVYLENYDMALARTLVAGVDVWLNTPLRPLEASGTSGM
jgi:starch phosphorylase